MTGLICSDGRCDGKSLLLVPTRLDAGAFWLAMKLSFFESFDDSRFRQSTFVGVELSLEMARFGVLEMLELNELRMSLFL